MRLIFTFFLYILFSAVTTIQAQTKKSVQKLVPQKLHSSSNTSTSKTATKSNIQLKGVWRGYFVQNNIEPITGLVYKEKYKYEVQINLLPTNALEGVTYSYQDTRFYGKTALKGIFTINTKNVIIKEIKMLELKMSSGSSDACLMTCYLEYSKVGDKEILKGEYSSVNMKSNRSDCGDGIVYLVKVPESDFVKEDFLLKKETKKPAVTDKKTIEKKPINTKKNDETPSNTTKPKVKPGAEDALVKKDASKPKDPNKEIVEVKKEEPKKVEIRKEVTPLPKVLTDRTNNLTKTIYVDEGEITVELYDNGQIDNDTVSVYHNGKPVLLNKMLNTTPLTVKINVSANEPTHELVMVADNLGRIPPNTALMMVKAGKKEYEVFLTSDLQKNAKVVFQYKPGAVDANKK